ncbi:MAG: MBL fold metallo-hydrolase [Gammaproteobacteria bacterium]|nr:MBL fold metallo-hydrolase [Gammaproteobacteria bacterium]
MWLTYARRTAFALVALLVLISLLLVLLWRDRAGVEDIGWATPAVASATRPDSVTVTWLGVTTLLFDDGETQILIDGFFSRPTLADVILDRPVDNDAPRINYAINEFRMRRLAAIIPVHSHFDHAMDIGAIANRTSASILGSASSAQIARGAGVPEDQITIAENSQVFEFGQFSVQLRPTAHVPFGWGGTVPLDGTIDEPLETPQPVSAWRMGGAYTVILEHPQGTALVQGSAGFHKYALRDVSADVIMLSVSQLDTMGRDYAELYWQHIVTATGGHSVYAIHFDDFTKPFGEVALAPRFIDNFSKTAGWLEGYRRRWDKNASLFVPEFGKPIAIFAQPAPES